MQKISDQCVYIGIVTHPEGTATPCPRQYFHTGRQLREDEVNDLRALLPTVCKHISNVFACIRTPNHTAATMYVSFGGLDPDARSTIERINKYTDDIVDTISEYFDAKEK